MLSPSTVLSGLTAALDIRQYLNQASVTLDIEVLHQQEDEDGSVQAAILVKLWNTGDEAAENGYLHFWPQDWMFQGLKPQKNAELGESYYPAEISSFDSEIHGFYTEFTDKPVFPGNSNRVATFLATFHPDEEYMLGYEVGCTEQSLRPGACMLWVNDGEIEYMRKDWTWWFAAKQRLSDLSLPTPVRG